MKSILNMQIKKPASISALCVFIIIAFLYILASYQQWITGYNPSWDQAIFTQLIKTYATFQAPIVPLKGEGFNLWGDHFHPILVLITPFYWLFPSTFTLFVVQAVLFAIGSAVFTYSLVKVFEHIINQKIQEQQKNEDYKEKIWKFISIVPWIFGIGGGLAFGVSWGLEAAFLVQFHEIAFAVPILSLALSYFVSQKFIPAVLWGGLLVFVKEELGLMVFMFGLVIAWRMWIIKKHQTSSETKASYKKSYKNTVRRPHNNHSFWQKIKNWYSKNRYVQGFFLAAWGLIWVWLSIEVIIPAFSTDSGYDYSERVAVSDLVSNPGGTISEILNNDTKMWTVLLLISVTAGAVFFSPISLLLLPNLGWRFLTPRDAYWGVDWHYDAVLMPIVFFCIVDMLYRIYNWQKKAAAEKDNPSYESHKKTKETSFDTIKTIFKKLVSYYGLYALIPITMIIAVCTVFTFSSQPIKNALNPESYEVSSTHKTLLEAVDMIDENSVVVSDLSFMNYVVDKSSSIRSGSNPVNTLYWAGDLPSAPADYIVQTGTIDIVQDAESYYSGTRYELIFNKDGVQVAKKVG